MTKLNAITQSKSFRQELDAILQRMKQFTKDLIGNTENKADFENHGETIAQNVISTRDLESAIMRQGMVLKNVGNPNPYPESYNPASPVVEPTADGIKL
jgi:uncharacterized protein YkuJ